MKIILHIDGDSFFASCEQALHPELKGKPVVVGKERGIAVAYSQEAKQLGVKRGMRMFEIQKVCPQAILLPSDYETYQLFSRRFMSLVRKITPDIEEYSIDECFADITGLDRVLRMPYETIAKTIQNDLFRELGCTFSVGLAPTKVLAKIASNYKKPNGFTALSQPMLSSFLSSLPVKKVWGIGPHTSILLEKYGISTAYEFIQKDEQWVQTHCSKPYYEIWKELQGISIMPLQTMKRPNTTSIQKTHTFSPSSSNKDIVFSELAYRIEEACARARKFKVAAQQATFILRTQTFQEMALRVTFSQATAFPNKIIHSCEQVFSHLFKPHTNYRATGVVLSKFTDRPSAQLDLFGKHLEIEKLKLVYKSVDAIRSRYGDDMVVLAASLPARKREECYELSQNNHLFPDIATRKNLSIPFLTGACPHTNGSYSI